MISGGTKHPAEAWTFIEWLSRQSVTTFSGPVYPGYLNARKSLNATQTASEFDDKQRQSDYEYTLANLPPLANYPNQDFTVAYSILGSTSMLFETPPKTAEEILASTVQSLVDNYVIINSVNPKNIGQYNELYERISKYKFLYSINNHLLHNYCNEEKINIIKNTVDKSINEVVIQCYYLKNLDKLCPRDT